MGETVISDPVPLGGGLDLVSSKLAINPGALLACQNYEPADSGGYRICDGFERYDGRVAPSAALFTVLDFSSGSTAIVAGNTVTGSVSGATGRVLLDAVVETGTWGGGDAAGYVVIFQTSTANFGATDALLVATVDVADVDTVNAAGDAPDVTSYHDWRILAAEYCRSLIQAVPGNGLVLGVWSYKGNVYAFRNDSTAGVRMYKSSLTGWTLIALNKYIKFGTGNDVSAPIGFSVGETVTGTSSGAHGIVAAIGHTAGDWSTADCVGHIVFTAAGVTGTFVDAEVLTGGTSGATARAIGTQVTPSFSATGRFEFINYNFTGSADTMKMYGCNGANPAFSYDGTTFVVIMTGMTTDTPTHITAHHNHLFLSFLGSLQHSGIGDPMTWTILAGANELTTGDEITGVMATQNGTMAVFTEHSISILYGSSSLDWQLKTLSDKYGAVEWTMQNTITPLFLSDAGLSVLPDTEKFGEFSGESVSGIVKPLVRRYRGLVTSSVALRRKGQYRLFFTGGDALTLKFVDGKVAGYGFMSYPFTVSGCSASIMSDRYLTYTGVEQHTYEDDRVFFYSDDDGVGYIYRMDSGSSFDGEDLVGFFRIPYNSLGNSRLRKQFRLIVIEIEMEAGDIATLYFKPDYGLFDSTISEAQQIQIVTDLSSGIWNESFWNEFYWASAETGGDNFAECRLEGVGCGLGGTFYYVGKDRAPHTIKSYLVHFDTRSMRR